MSLRNVKALRGLETTRIETTVGRICKFGDVTLEGKIGDYFGFPKGASISKVAPEDMGKIEKARDLMARCLGEDEVEEPKVMAKYLKDKRKYLLVFEKKGKGMLGASLGFYNPKNKSAMHIILTVDEKARQKGIGGALSSAHAIVAAQMAGGVREISFITGELVPGEYLVAMARIYGNAHERSALAAKFAYPLPPLSDNWGADKDMQVLWHIPLLNPVNAQRSGSAVSAYESDLILVGNQIELYGPEKARIITKELEMQLGGAQTVGLADLTEPMERYRLLEYVKAVETARQQDNTWTPAAIRKIVGHPLPEEIQRA